MSETEQNTFTSGPLPAIYAKTALPIIFVMSMSGFLAVADALFLGTFVGPEALAAVTLMFPPYMLIVALATLVANGMASLLARALGARDFEAARGVFAGAHGLALLLGVILIGLYLAFGTFVTELAAGGNAELAEMGRIYLGITVFYSPLLFVLSVNSDALRNEGRVGFMAAMSLLVSLSNIGFNYLLIAVLEMGVAGSAYGTAMAQALSFCIILAFRLRGRTELRPGALLSHSPFTKWGRILALGAPQSLGFLGISFSAGAIVGALQWVGAPGYPDTIAAYGIVTRIMTFVFLPLLGLSHAMQSITGNNFGAGLWHRSDSSLRMGIVVAFVYCLFVQVIVTVFAAPMAGWFVDAPNVISEVARIMPIMVALFIVAGPVMMIGTYFQAIGDATRAALLGLTKPYLFVLPLTFLLPLQWGEVGIWLASPLAEVLLLILTIIVLVHTARRNVFRWGLFRAEVA